MHDVLHALNEPSYLTMCETYRKIATDIRDALFTCCMHENYSCKQLDRDSTHYRVAIPELRSTPYALPKRRAIRTVINNIHKQYQCTVSTRPQQIHVSKDSAFAEYARVYSLTVTIQPRIQSRLDIHSNDSISATFVYASAANIIDMHISYGFRYVTRVITSSVGFRIHTKVRSHTEVSTVDFKKLNEAATVYKLPKVGVS